jgi:hypothetical protein
MPKVLIVQLSVYLIQRMKRAKGLTLSSFGFEPDGLLSFLGGILIHSTEDRNVQE